jgi:hypothetical protein
LWRPKELTSPTDHPNNTRESTFLTNNTTTIQSLTTNKQPNVFKWNTWTNQQLKDTINVVERGHTYFKKSSKYYNIMLTSFSYHLNGRTRSKKMNPQGVLTEQKNEKITTWVQNMQKVG